jgi:hypothetical protein
MSTPVSGVNFAASYVPPGVYVSTKSTGSTGAVGVGDTVICLVGRGVGYHVATESVSFDQGNRVQLKQLGIDPAPVPFVVNDNGLVTYPGGGSVLVVKPWSGDEPYAMDGEDTNDYFLDQVADPSDEADKSKFTTYINRSAGSTIPATPGSNVLVRYHYTDPGYYQLHSFTDYATFAALYGPAVHPSTGQLNSPLSLAAQFALQNGASVLYAVACESTDGGPPTAAQFEAAYARTVPNYDINIMVPLWEDASGKAAVINQLGPLRSFLNLSADSGFPRIALCGAASDYSLADGSSPADVATGTANKRIVWLWPQAYNTFNPVLAVNGGAFEVDGFYAAAAAAGFLANNEPNQGLTGTQLQGFTGLPVEVLKQLDNFAEKNDWSAAGVCLYEQNRLNQIVCRHGVTTDVSDVGTREISIVRCQDALFVEIELTLIEANLIGSPIVEETPATVQALVMGALEAAAGNDTIADYGGVSVTQQRLPSGDPTVIEVTFNYQPTYPLNYITVTFTLDLSTGNISGPSSNNAGGGGSGLQAAG